MKYLIIEEDGSLRQAEDYNSEDVTCVFGGLIDIVRFDNEQFEQMLVVEEEVEVEQETELDIEPETEAEFLVDWERI